MDIGGWLRGLGLERYEQAFRDNEIDEEVLPGAVWTGDIVDRCSETSWTACASSAHAGPWGEARTETPRGSS